MKIQFALHFDKGYIAHPYWPEQERLINILKESGAKRVRSQERAEKALRDYLGSKGMTLDDYRKLEDLANRPFYTRNGKAPGGEIIIISEHQVYGMLAAGCSLASSSLRIARPEQVRSVLISNDWETGKTEADGVWERFVVVTGGQGKLSNQRALRSNPYIENFNASGELKFSEEILRPEKVKDFIAFCGAEVGIGASRKLGWGRFTIEEWSAPLAPPASPAPNG